LTQIAVADCCEQGGEISDFIKGR